MLSGGQLAPDSAVSFAQSATVHPSFTYSLWPAVV